MFSIQWPVVFAHGPNELATIDYLSSINCAYIVDQPSDEAVESTLITLSKNPSLRNKLHMRVGN